MQLQNFAPGTSTAMSDRRSVKPAGNPLVRFSGPGLIVAFAVVVVSSHLARPEGGAGAVSYLIATVGAALLGCLALVVRGTDPVRIWLALGLTASALGDIAWQVIVTTGQEAPDVSVADIGRLASYLLVGAGLVVAIRRNGVRRCDAPEVMFDVATCVAISTILVGLLWVSPSLLDNAQPMAVRLVWSAYPVLDAVLLGLVVRALLDDAKLSRALIMMASGIAVWLVSDVGFLIVGPVTAASPVLNVGWMLGRILLAAGTWAYAHNAQPMRRSQAPRERPVGRFRIALGIVLIFVPSLFELRARANGWTLNRLSVLASTVVLCGLAYVRAVHLLSVRNRAASLTSSNERLYRALSAHSGDATVLLNAEGRLLRDSPSLAALVGRELVGTAGTDILTMVDSAQFGVASIRNHFQRAISKPGEAAEFEFPVLVTGPEPMWLAARLVNLLDDADVGGVVVNFHDITERKRAEAVVYRALSFDGLTGLPNRHALSRHVKDELAAPGRGLNCRVGAALVDVSRFRAINDGLGRSSGDEVLRQVASRLGGVVRKDDFVARVGGDVFAVFTRRTSRAQFADFAQRIASTIAQPLQITSRELELSSCIGIALASPGCDTDSLLAAADDALYRAKSRGAGRVTIIDVAESEACGSLDTELELRAAIARGQLELEYQAVMDIHRRRIDGFEALVRWNHPTRGRLEAGEFISLAEETGLIVPLGAWVLDTAITTAGRWNDQHSISINLSPMQVAEPGISEVIEELLVRHDFDPHRLILEVTESALISEDQEVTGPLERLRRLGVRIAIDDFGSGYSSFAYLRRLPVDILKIDKSFIDDLPGAGEPIVSAIIGLASALNLDVVAEGVEYDDQLDTLDRLDCRHAQGFLLHPPAPATELCIDVSGLRIGDGSLSHMNVQRTDDELQMCQPRSDQLTPTAHHPYCHHRAGAAAMPALDVNDPVKVAPQVSTKRTLATLSHAVEEIAAAAGPDATVIALFQRGPYFSPMVARYEQMARRGSTVIVAYAGEGPTASGVHHVTLADDASLCGEWAIVLITPGVAAHVSGVDLVDFDPTAPDLESGRQFSATWGFDRHDACMLAEQLLPQLENALEPEVVRSVRSAVKVARHAPVSVTERSLSAAARVLAGRVDRTQQEITAATTRLAAETEIAIRDPLTGLLNREGLQRWLGGVDTDGLAMPPMGVILIDLDGFKQINDTMGHPAGDSLLQGVAAAILRDTRLGDVAARWGGDEFIVLCPHSADDELGIIAQRLLDGIAAVDVDGARVTASAGIQTCSQRPLPLGQADSALYAAKRAGGGRPVAAGS